MARQGKGINVKVPRVKVIAALRQALNKLELDYTSQAELKSAWEKANEEYNKAIMEWAMARYARATNIRINYREYSKKVNVDFDVDILDNDNFPQEPKANYTYIAEHVYEEQREEISNAIRILEMCEDESINTGTYGNISKYL
jgi:hypothetical protein